MQLNELQNFKNGNMKKIVSIIFAVITAVSLFSCSPKKEPERKMVGVIADFNPAVKKTFVVGGRFIAGGDFPLITFSDGRFVYLRSMPDIQMNKGDSIKIFYLESSKSSDGIILADSVTQL